MNEKPDLICLSKGLTGGTMAMGVTSCTEKIYQEFVHSEEITERDSIKRTFFHGHSFTANPLSCTAALASMDLLQAESCIQNIQRISSNHLNFIKNLGHSESIKETRTLGTILVIELQTQNSTSYFHPLREKIYAFFLGKGIILRPLGNVIYFMPPYIITDEEMNVVYDAIREFIGGMQGLGD